MSKLMTQYGSLGKTYPGNSSNGDKREDSPLEERNSSLRCVATVAVRNNMFLYWLDEVVPCRKVVVWGGARLLESVVFTKEAKFGCAF